MKFALLVATTAAVRISSLEQGGPPSCDDIWGMVTKHCDGDKDGSISWKEARKCGAPKQAKGDFDDAAGSDGEVDKDEFMEECDKHMKGKDGLAEVSIEGGHCKRMAAAIWKHCDANGDKTISWKEASACGAPPQWKPKFDAVAGKDGEVDHKEFMAACKAHGGLAEEEVEAEVEGGHCKRMAAAIWKHCDANGDKTISWKEASGCGAPPQWKPKFDAVAGKDGEVDHKEFMAACKAHGGLAEEEEEVEGPPCGKIWKMIRSHCDKDGDKTISWKEARACGAPKDAKAGFTKFAGKDGKVDKGDFMDICHKHM
jgi:hypothetical protein